MKNQSNVQNTLFSEPTPDVTPAKHYETEAAKHALDELFLLAQQYQSSQAYKALMEFVVKFHFYSPYNAMLIHIQMPGATFVAPPSRWVQRYWRKVTSEARPLVILRPMGPVMFVFDLSDTQPLTEPERLAFGKKLHLADRPETIPLAAEKPFDAKGWVSTGRIDRTIANAARDGVRIVARKEGAQSAGSIRRVDGQNLPPLTFVDGKDAEGHPRVVSVQQRYDLLLNEDHPLATRYATIAHELGHLYCGHLGTPDPNWWPDRQGLPKTTEEFEAESVAYLVCKRIGVQTTADRYLSGYLDANQQVPEISMECVMKAAGLIEQMGSTPLRMRKKKTAGTQIANG